MLDLGGGEAGGGEAGGGDEELGLLAAELGAAGDHPESEGAFVAALLRRYQEDVSGLPLEHPQVNHAQLTLVAALVKRFVAWSKASAHRPGVGEIDVAVAAPVPDFSAIPDIVVPEAVEIPDEIAKIRERAESFVAGARLFYFAGAGFDVTHQEAYLNGEAGGRARSSEDRIKQLGVEGLLRQFNETLDADEMVAPSDAHRALKTLHDGLNLLVEAESRRLFPGEKTTSIRTLEHMATMASRKAALASEFHDEKSVHIAPGDRLSLGPTDPEHPDVEESMDDVAMYAASLPIVWLSDAQVREYLDLLEEHTSDPAWFSALPKWDQHYIKAQVAVAKEEASAVDAESINVIMARYLGVSGSTYRSILGASHFEAIRLSVGGSDEALMAGAVTLYRLASVVPEMKLISSQSVLLDRATANLRQAVMWGVSQAVQQGRGRIERIEDGLGGVKEVRVLPIPFITLLSPLIADGIVGGEAAANDNHLMVKTLRLAILEVCKELAGPIIISGQLVKVNLYAITAAMNERRNEPGTLSKLAFTPGDELAYLRDVMLCLASDLGLQDAMGVKHLTALVKAIEGIANLHKVPEATRYQVRDLCGCCPTEHPAYRILQCIAFICDTPPQPDGESGLNIVKMRAAAFSIIASAVVPAFAGCKSAADRLTWLVQSVMGLVKSLYVFGRPPLLAITEEEEDLAFHRVHGEAFDAEVRRRLETEYHAALRAALAEPVKASDVARHTRIKLDALLSECLERHPECLDEHVAEIDAAVAARLDGMPELDAATVKAASILYAREQHYWPYQERLEDTLRHALINKLKALSEEDAEAADIMSYEGHKRHLVARYAGLGLDLSVVELGRYADAAFSNWFNTLSEAERVGLQHDYLTAADRAAVTAAVDGQLNDHIEQRRATLTDQVHGELVSKKLIELFADTEVEGLDVEGKAEEEEPVTYRQLAENQARQFLQAEHAHSVQSTIWPRLLSERGPAIEVAVKAEMAEQRGKIVALLPGQQAAEHSVYVTAMARFARTGFLSNIRARTARGTWGAKEATHNLSAKENDAMEAAHPGDSLKVLARLADSVKPGGRPEGAGCASVVVSWLGQARCGVVSEGVDASLAVEAEALRERGLSLGAHNVWCQPGADSHVAAESLPGVRDGLLRWSDAVRQTAGDEGVEEIDKVFSAGLFSARGGLLAALQNLLGVAYGEPMSYANLRVWVAMGKQLLAMLEEFPGLEDGAGQAALLQFAERMLMQLGWMRLMMSSPQIMPGLSRLLFQEGADVDGAVTRPQGLKRTTKEAVLRVMAMRRQLGHERFDALVNSMRGGRGWCPSWEQIIRAFWGQGANAHVLAALLRQVDASVPRFVVDEEGHLTFQPQTVASAPHWLTGQVSPQGLLASLGKMDDFVKGLFIAAGLRPEQAGVIVGANRHPNSFGVKYASEVIVLLLMVVDQLNWSEANRDREHGESDFEQPLVPVFAFSVFALLFHAVTKRLARDLPGFYTNTGIRAQLDELPLGSYAQESGLKTADLAVLGFMAGFIPAEVVKISDGQSLVWGTVAAAAAVVIEGLAEVTLNMGLMPTWQAKLGLFASKLVMGIGAMCVLVWGAGVLEYENLPEIIMYYAAPIYTAVLAGACTWSAFHPRVAIGEAAESETAYTFLGHLSVQHPEVIEGIEQDSREEGLALGHEDSSSTMSSVAHGGVVGASEGSEAGAGAPGTVASLAGTTVLTLSSHRLLDTGAMPASAAREASGGQLLSREGSGALVLSSLGSSLLSGSHSGVSASRGAVEQEAAGRVLLASRALGEAPVADSDMHDIAF